MKRLGRWLIVLARLLVYVCLVVLLTVVGLLAVVETGWGKNWLRELIVREGNQYLTADLEIERLRGSLLRGIQLSGVRLSRGGVPFIQIDDVSVEYSIRELFERGTSIRRIRIARPHVIAAREADGRWNLSALIKRDTQRQERRGPGRPLHLQAIEVTDGHVEVRNELKFGTTILPTIYDDLDLRLSFDYEPVTWSLNFDQASWKGQAPALTIGSLTGTLQNGPDGWQFSKLTVETPASHVIVDGVIDRSRAPTELRLEAKAERFSFPEWAQVLPVISRIGVTGSFDAVLRGPLAKLDTAIEMRSTGGDAQGRVVLNTTVPGWRFAGALDLNRLDLAPWLSRPEDRSDISGHVQFDLGVQPGAHFPHGSYVFDGSHAAFMGYEADHVQARGTITATDALIERGAATAYGANVTLDSGRIGIDAPYPFSFTGFANGVDLRMVPPQVPVPHVESTLALRYDVRGQFSSSYLIGQAQFAPSTFLGATIEDGAIGSIDTQASPFTYSGEGGLTNVDLHRFGVDLGIAWLQEPRYAGQLDGRFKVDGRGSDLATMRLEGGGHVTRADIFDGTLSDGETAISIENGTLTGSYDGRLSQINPAIAMDDPRYDARLNGSGSGTVTVAELLIRSPELNDYTVNANLQLSSGSEVRGVPIDRGAAVARMAGSTLTFDSLSLEGPALALTANGALELDGTRSSRLHYTVSRSDLAQLKMLTGRDLEGQMVTTGQWTGPWNRIRLVGDGTLSGFAAGGVHVLTTAAKYDATIPIDEPDSATASVDGRMSFVEGFGQQLKEVTGQVQYDDGNVSADLRMVRSDDLTGAVATRARIDRAARTADLDALTLTIARSSWTLAAGTRPRVGWNERGISVAALTLVDAPTRQQQVTADGTWLYAGDGRLTVTARRLSLDTLFAGAAPSRFGGTLSLDAVVSGTSEHPLVTSTVNIVDGRVWRTPYQRLGGRLDYRDGDFDVDLRLDQGPGVWLTAKGTMPLGVAVASAPDRPINLVIASSRVGLGLIEGSTSVVRNVAGTMELNVTVVGTARDPHVDGRIEVNDAAFLAVSSGARYKNGRLAVQFRPDRITVERLHLEDNSGHPLDVSGSLATHELRVSDLVVDLRARQFQVLRNEYGQLDIDAAVSLRGQFESPKLTGRITVTGGDLAVDRILDRALFQPYATTASGPVDADAIVALNPWERLGLDVEVHVPNTLRLVGDNVQVTPGTPLGLGDINLRALGDLYFYKDPAQPLYINGSLDSVTGTYRFQGRRFDLDPSSSITFRGDLNPELYVTVRRDISGVETRVTIAGAMQSPELRLASTPPLDPSDILSLIVFNTSTNELSALQQEQLAVRAGTLAAGFVTAPLLTALERSLGLSTLEIEPVADVSGSGARVTIGDELAPGLIARFSRQFGETEYDEATIEYYLSRLLSIRATFSDATGLAARSPFRRVERAGIDLLIFFSF